MQKQLNQLLNHKIKTEYSVKNNWDLTLELNLLLTFLSNESKQLPLFIYWLENYFEAVNLPFSLLENCLLEIDGNHSLVRKDLSEGLKVKVKIEEIELCTDIHIDLFQTVEKHSKPEYRSYIYNDAEKHLEFLKQSIETDSIVLFTEYIAWANTMLNALNIDTSTLIRFLVTLRTVSKANELTSEVAFLDHGIQMLLEGNVVSATSEISFTTTEESKKYLELLLQKERNGAKNYILALADGGMDIREIFLDVFQATQYELGRLWELNRITIAQEHYCTAATQTFMAMLTARIVPDKRIDKKVIATCVGTEQHELGIRIVNDFLEMEGWDTYYLGANVPMEAIILAIKENQPDLLALSVTLTPHIKNVINIIQKVKNIFPDIKILVGGYPFLRDNSLAEKIGADGVALDAKQAPQVALKLVQNP